MPKAVKITKSNQNFLESAYGLESDELDEYVGYYLVAEFGDPQVTGIDGFLSYLQLVDQFTIGTQKLLNGYIEVTPK